MKDDDDIYDVLILCTGNSARSIIAECVLQRAASGRMRAHSAGSQPKGEVHPLALQILRDNGYMVGDLRSKNWDEFAGTDAPKLDFVVTVCDNAAGEVCPIWPGQPISAHWGIPDPAAVVGSEAARRLAFEQALSQLTRRIQRFVDLPFGSLEHSEIRQKFSEIGHIL